MGWESGESLHEMRCRKGERWERGKIKSRSKENGFQIQIFNNNTRVSCQGQLPHRGMYSSLLVLPDQLEHALGGMTTRMWFEGRL